MDVPSTAAGVIESVGVKKGDRVSKGSVIAQRGRRRRERQAPRTAKRQRLPGRCRSRRAAAQAEASHASGPQTAAEAEAPRPAPAAAARRHRQPRAPAVADLGRLLAGSRQSFRAQVRARAGRGSQSRARARASRAASRHDDVKAWVKQALTAAGACCRRRRIAEGPGGRLREVRRRSRSSRSGASRRFPVRACRRAGSTCRTSRRWTKPTSPSSRQTRDKLKDEGEQGRRQADAARIHPARRASRRCRSFRWSTLARRSRPEPRVEEVHAPGLRGRYAERPGRAGDSRRRQARMSTSSRASSRRCRRRPARASCPRAEMQGASFTVSSLGGIGGTAFTPIINAPEVAILGVSRSQHAAGLQGRAVRAAPDPAVLVRLRSSRRSMARPARASRRSSPQKLADVKGLLEAVP